MCKESCNTDLKNAALIVAGGSGSRMNSGKDENGVDINKVFLPLEDKPVLAHTLLTFQKCDFISTIAVVTRKCDLKYVFEIKEKYNVSKLDVVCEGGATRVDSVRNGLKALFGLGINYVFIHDAARCLIDFDTINACFNDAKIYGASAPGVFVKDSIKSIDEHGFIKCDIERKYVVKIQTPQVFEFDEILQCHKKAAEEKFEATDDTSVYMHFGKKVYISAGKYENIKITTPEDMVVAKQILMRKEN